MKWKWKYWINQMISFSQTMIWCLIDDFQSVKKYNSLRGLQLMDFDLHQILMKLYTIFPRLSAIFGTDKNVDG